MNKISVWKKEAAQGLYDAGWKLREQGEYKLASSLLIQAFFLFQELDDWWMMAECLNHMGIGFKNLYRQSENKSWAILAEHNFTAAYEIMLHHGIDDNQTAFQASKLGEAALVNQNFHKAVDFFQIAVDKAKDSSGASLGNRKYHLGLAQFLLGYQQKDQTLQQDGHKLVEEGIQMIKEELDKNKDQNQKQQLQIWYTGGLLALARILYQSDPEKAHEIAENALSIATRKNLAIRIQQAKFLIKAIQTCDDVKVHSSY